MARPRIGVLGSLLAATGLLGTGLACSNRPPALETAERAVLERELANLVEYLEVDYGRLLTEGDLLVVIPERVVGDLVAAALPLEGEVADRYRIRLDQVRIDFRTGCALLQLDGRVSMRDRPSVFGDVTVFASLDVAGIAADPPLLELQPEVLAVEAREIEVGGLSAPVASLIDEIARRRLGDLTALLGTLQLPIGLHESVRLPAVETDEVTIPQLEMGVGIRLEQILVADRRLWITAALDVSGDNVRAPSAVEADPGGIP